MKGEIARPLRGDVEAIVAKAMSKLPQDRYETVNALIEDIERHRQNIPVRAQPPQFWYRLRKFVVRNKASVAGGAVTVSAMVAGLSVALWQTQIAQTEAQRAERIKSFIASIFTQAVPKQGVGGVVTASELLTAATRRVEAELGNSKRDKSELQAMIGASFLQLDEAAKAVDVLQDALNNCETGSRDYESCRLHAAANLAGALQLAGDHGQRAAENSDP
jgi:eukaryotic-like serine/threonine-protein kinase